MENPKLLAKDNTCGDDGCPSVWLADGAFTVLGPVADLGTVKNALPGEVACRIDIDVVRRALAAYDAETSG